MTRFPNPAVLLLAAMIGCEPAETPKDRKGDISMTGGYAFAPVDSQGVAYISLRNLGRHEDTLLAISSPLAGEVTLHESTQEGNSLRMVKLDQLIMPPGLAVEMAPGSLHLMLTQLRMALPVGKQLPLRLEFARAGALEVMIPINQYGETR